MISLTCSLTSLILSPFLCLSGHLPPCRVDICLTVNIHHIQTKEKIKQMVRARVRGHSDYRSPLFIFTFQITHILLVGIKQKPIYNNHICVYVCVCAYASSEALPVVCSSSRMFSHSLTANQWLCMCLNTYDSHSIWADSGRKLC